MQEIKNPGFEDGTPNNWLSFGTGTTHKYIYPEPGRAGGYSLSIEYPTRDIGKMAMFTQDVNIDPAKIYTLSGWLKTKNIMATTDNSGAAIQVDWKDTNRNYLSTSVIMPRQKGDISWTYFEGKTSPNPKAKIATIVLVLYDCSGKVWFDDILFTSDVTPQKKYRCTGAPDYKCIEDQNGPYNSLVECQSICKVPGQYHECSTNNCQFIYKEFRLMNNKWGDSSAKQSVWYYDNDGFGWSSERYNTTWQIPNYPEVLIGRHPLENSGSTTPIFPIKWSNVMSWKATIGYEYLIQPAQGWQHNTGYDIYIIDPTKSGNARKMSNFMIWCVGRFGTSTEKVTDGINTYTYHHKSPGSGPETWHWHGFILEDQTNYYPKGIFSCDIKKLMDIVRQKDTAAGRPWNSNWLLNGTEFGTEFYAGKGKVKVNQFHMDLNGQIVRL